MTLHIHEGRGNNNHKANKQNEQYVPLNFSAVMTIVSPHENAFHDERDDEHAGDNIHDNISNSFHFRLNIVVKSTFECTGDRGDGGCR